jgi:hypothetical protein
MRTVLTLALGLLFVGAGFADDKAVNTKCPKSGKECDGTNVAKVKDKDGKEVKVAGCCDKCVAAIEKDPAKYVPAAQGNKKAE